MTSIEKIRAEVEHERSLHHGCTGCRTLRLAEDKLKLALFVANDPGDEAQALLAEVAR